MLILISGIPGTGKSHIGRWAESNRNMTHIDMEDWQRSSVKDLWDKDDIKGFARQAQIEYGNAILSWGYPAHCFDKIKLMKSSGVHTVWLDGPLLLCRRHWKPKQHQPISTFQNQIAGIATISKELEEFYKDRIVSVFDEFKTHRKEEEILDEIILKI